VSVPGGAGLGRAFRRSRRVRWGIAGVVVLLEAWGALYHLGRVWGSTKDERRKPLPGDDLVARPAVVTDHAIDIEAPPERVWPWLLQMGWGRGG
jgi:hypothetical protein